MNRNNRDFLQQIMQMLQSDPGQRQGLNMANLGRLGVTSGLAGLAGNLFGGPIGAIIGSAATALLNPTTQFFPPGLLSPNPQSRQSGFLSPNPQCHQSGFLSPNPQSRQSGLRSPNPQSSTPEGLAEMVDNALNEDQRSQLADILQQLLGTGRAMSSELREQVMRIIINFLQQNTGGSTGRQGRGRARSCNC